MNKIFFFEEKNRLKKLWLTNANFQMRGGRFAYILSVGEKKCEKTSIFMTTLFPLLLLNF